MNSSKSKSEDKFHLVANSAALPPFWARAVERGLFSIILATLVIQQFIDKSLLDAFLFIAFLIVIMGGLVYFIKKANKNMQLTVDSERIQSTDDSTIARTAHFSQIKKLRLTGNNIYVWYSGGSKERFILPAHSEAEYEQLKKLLRKSANQNGTNFEEKRNWI